MGGGFFVVESLFCELFNGALACLYFSRIWECGQPAEQCWLHNESGRSQSESDICILLVRVHAQALVQACLHSKDIKPGHIRRGP